MTYLTKNAGKKFGIFCIPEYGLQSVMRFPEEDDKKAWG
jgi:hypothetical protein